MACLYGNCNDANCAAGQATDVNGNPCDDASCAPCGSTPVTGAYAAYSANLAAGTNPVAAGATSATNNGPSGLASFVTSLGSLASNIGATVVATNRGVATAASPLSAISGNSTGFLLLAAALIVGVFVFAGRKQSA